MKIQMVMKMQPLMRASRDIYEGPRQALLLSVPLNATSDAPHQQEAD